MSESLKKIELLHRQKEKELQELFDRTNWIFDEEEKKKLPRRKKEIYMPDGIDVLKLTNSMELEVDWKKNLTKKSMFPLVMMTIFWNIVVFVIVIGMVSAGALTSLVFISLHALIGTGMLYYILSLLFNQTRIFISADKIEINHTPVFSIFHRNRTIQTKDISQFYVKRYVSGTVNGIPNYAYVLLCKTKSGQVHTLIKGLNHESLLFLEQEIENYIGIKDKITGDEFIDEQYSKT